MAAFTTEPNRRIGSIEHVGEDGFIVEAVDINDPNFYGGKRLLPNLNELLRFLATHLQVYKSKGNTYGMKPPGWTEEVERERALLQEEGRNVVEQTDADRGNGAGKQQLSQVGRGA
jgi:hypothetical protein